MSLVPMSGTNAAFGFIASGTGDMEARQSLRSRSRSPVRTAPSAHARRSNTTLLGASQHEIVSRALPKVSGDVGTNRMSQGCTQCVTKTPLGADVQQRQLLRSPLVEKPLNCEEELLLLLSGKSKNEDGDPRGTPVSRGLNGASFSSYLVNSSLRRSRLGEEQEEEEEAEAWEKSCGIAWCSDGSGSSFHEGESLVDDPADSVSSSTRFTTELNAYLQKLADCSEKLERVLCANEGVVLGAVGRSKVGRHVDGIRSIVEKLRVVSRDTERNLMAHDQMLKATMARTRMDERRIIRLTAEKEGACNSMREAMMQAARELQQERAALKTLLLELTDQREQETHTLESAIGDEKMVSARGGGDTASPLSVVLQRSTLTECNPITSGASGLGGVPDDDGGEDDDDTNKDAAAASRRHWIYAHALGYFSDCKEPSKPECVCPMIAHMESYEMANDVLRSRRQMSLILQLITRSPAAMQFYLGLLKRQMEAMRIAWTDLERECLSKKQQLYERCLQ